MKKFFLAIFSILTIGFISSCAKESNVKPASAITQTDVNGDKSDMGSGD